MITYSRNVYASRLFRFFHCYLKLAMLRRVAHSRLCIQRQAYPTRHNCCANCGNWKSAILKEHNKASVEWRVNQCLEKNPLEKSRQVLKFNSAHRTPSPFIESETRWWKASPLTKAPILQSVIAEREGFLPIAPPYIAISMACGRWQRTAEREIES